MDVVNLYGGPPNRLADDYFLISLDDRSGRARLATSVRSLGLASALVGELVLEGYLMVADSELFPLTGQLPPEPLSAEVMKVVLARQNERDLGVWLTFLAAEAVTDVGDRLARDGTVVRRQRRRIGGTRIEYLPPDLSAAAWPGIRLGNLLASGEPVQLSDVLLTGIVEATGLLGHVLWDGDVHRPGYAHVERLLPQLPAPITALLTRTRVAVGDVLLTKRG
jgi:hypothetical protein